MRSPIYFSADGNVPSFSQQDIPPMLLRTPLARLVSRPCKVVSRLFNIFLSFMLIYNIDIDGYHSFLDSLPSIEYIALKRLIFGKGFLSGALSDLFSF